MKTSQFNTRTCILTREKLAKNELIRIVKNKNQEIFIDLKQNMPGRGCYVKPSQENFLKLKEKRLLNRNLRCEVSKDIYEQLLNLDL